MCFNHDQIPDTTPPTPIEVDSDLGLKIGLTSDVFVPASHCSDFYPYGTQLYRKGNSMYIQAIEIWAHARNKKHFNQLLDTLWDSEFTVKVANPVRLMEIILLGKGFQKIEEQDLTSSTSEIQVVYFKNPPPKATQNHPPFTPPA